MGQLLSGPSPQVPTYARDTSRQTYDEDDDEDYNYDNHHIRTISSTPTVRQANYNYETPLRRSELFSATSARQAYDDYDDEYYNYDDHYPRTITSTPTDSPTDYSTTAFNCSTASWPQLRTPAVAVTTTEPIIINKPATVMTTRQNPETMRSTYEEHSTVTVNGSDSYERCWDLAKLLEHMANISTSLARTFVQLIQEGNTLPFIARYRKHIVENLPPQRLQTIFDCYEHAREVKERGIDILISLEKSKKLTPEIKQAIVNTKSISDLDFIYEPLKSAEVSLADHARELGLEPVAVKAMNDRKYNLMCGVRNHPEMDTIPKVEQHVTHIIGDKIYRDNRVVRVVKKWRHETVFTLKCTRVKTATGEFTELIDSKKDPDLYKLYYDFQCTNDTIQAHQTLAINRGEKVNILAVEIIVPNSFYLKLESFCLNEWKGRGVMSKGISEAYLRFIKPWLTRQVRLSLTKTAERISIRTFTNNVERLLLTEPLKNKTILGIDPGYQACKMAVIDPEGKKITTKIIFPFTKPVLAEGQLLELISSFGLECVYGLRPLEVGFCSRANLTLTFHRNKILVQPYDPRPIPVNVLALGDGKGCRETEQWLKKLTKVPLITAVPETGASIYSITEQARKDDPHLDCNLLSALSIARRVLDPLAEYVKIDPKNLGVGMYQHDINAKMLACALDAVVQKVVSLVGADLNTASYALLRRIAGLNDSKAEAIIRYRRSRRFRCRTELLRIPAIDDATYQQCAGFLRINEGINPLDKTIIHPESYDIAKRFLQLVSIPIAYVCSRDKAHLDEVRTQMGAVDMTAMSEKLHTDVFTLKLIANACKQEKEDNLLNFTKPVFSSAALTISQIKEGMIIEGVVRNVTTFGCFVDCGLEYNGLIHISKMKKGDKPQLGNRVSVKVRAPPESDRLSLQLVKILH